MWRAVQAQLRARSPEGEPAGAKVLVDDDAYAECYPGYHTMGTSVVDSDDEDKDKVRYALCGCLPVWQPACLAVRLAR